LVAIIGLVIAALVGWTMMAIGARRLEQAKKLRAESEGRLMAAVEFAAREATREAQDAQVAVNRSNWGEAGTGLDRVDGLVTLMEQVRPESQRGAVEDARGELGDAQRLVREQSRDAAESMNALVAALDKLRGQKAG
jgi:hypothetical protein